MITAVSTENRILVPCFFARADVLREKLESALAADARNGSGPLNRVASPGAYAFLVTTADQVFTHDLVLEFLIRLRQWAKEKLGTQHASTPQIHIYIDGCQRQLAPDASPARWHYLFSLTRGQLPELRLLEYRKSRKRFGITLGLVARPELPFNCILAHETRLAYGVEGPRRTNKPLEGTVLLHGYLW